jgi:hypothetical protein
MGEEGAKPQKYKVRFCVERTDQGRKDFLRFEAEHGLKAGEAPSTPGCSQMALIESRRPVTKTELNKAYKGMIFLSVEPLTSDTDTTEMAATADIRRIRKGIGLDGQIS